MGITSKEEDSELFLELECQRTDWYSFVKEGEPVDAAGSGATTSAIGAMTFKAGGSILGGEESFHEVRVLNCCV
nr:hypothetical protein [Tanacetum cinerariifolium]